MQLLFVRDQSFHEIITILIELVLQEHALDRSALEQLNHILPMFLRQVEVAAPVLKRKCELIEVEFVFVRLLAVLEDMVEQLEVCDRAWVLFAPQNEALEVVIPLCGDQERGQPLKGGHSC